MNHILSVNAGSSSLKLALFRAEAPEPERVRDARIERLGPPGSRLLTRRVAQRDEIQPVDADEHGAAAEILLSWLGPPPQAAAIVAVGHRIVHGGPRHLEPCVLTDEVLAELRGLAAVDAEHLPVALDLVAAISRVRPDLLQIACFDTTFHRQMPQVARMLPLPRRFFDAGLCRYGFHGLSYQSALNEIARTEGEAATRGRLVLAHLGGGTSLAAVLDGRCVDTTMAFTPASGVPMGTRSGDIDPGLVSYLARTEEMSIERFDHVVNRESGLLGISETTSDVQGLLARAPNDPRAADAVALFCYEVKKRIGALAAALGGIDGLVFTGGIGEHAAPIRARICDGLQFLGVELEPDRNESSARLISVDRARVTVRVVRADEERIIAKATLAFLDAGQRSQEPIS